MVSPASETRNRMDTPPRNIFAWRLQQYKKDIDIALFVMIVDTFSFIYIIHR